MTKPRITTLRARVLAYVAANPGASAAEIDRRCRTARGGHKWMYAAVARMRKAGLLARGPARTAGEGKFYGPGGAVGLFVTAAGSSAVSGQ